LAPELKGRLLTALGVLILTPDSLLVRLISVDQWTLIFWRGLLSAMALFAWLLVMNRGQALAKLRAVGSRGLFIAACFTVSVICFVTAITTTSVANTLIIIAASPFVTAVMSHLFLRESTRRRTWFTMAVATCGIALAVSDNLGGGTMLGDLAAAGTALSVSAAFTALRRGKGTDMVPALVVSGLMTACVTLPLASPLAVSGADTGYLAILGLFVVPVSFGLVTVGPRYLPAPEVNLFMLIETVLGPVWVWAILSEAPTANAIAGGLVVLAALAAESAIALRHTRLASQLKPTEDETP